MRQKIRKSVVMLLTAAMIMTSGIFTVSFAGEDIPAAAKQQTEAQKEQNDAEKAAKSETEKTESASATANEEGFGVDEKAAETAKGSTEQSGQVADVKEKQEASESNKAAEEEADPENNEEVIVADIPVVYEDGTLVEDERAFDIDNRIDWPETINVKNGKLSGLRFIPGKEYRIGISWDDLAFFNLDIVGKHPNTGTLKVGIKSGSNKLMVYDDKGKKVSDKAIEKIVLKKLPSTFTLKVQYKDGSSVEDGRILELHDIATNKIEPITTQGGKITGVNLYPNKEYRLGIGWDDELFWDQSILGADENTGTLRIGTKFGDRNVMMYEKDKGVTNTPLTKVVLLVNEDEEADKPVPAQENVNVGDIKVEYEDGTPVEDGVKFDLFDMTDLFSNPVSSKYTTKDGKLSGIKMLSETQYKIGFDVSNENWSKLEVVGAYKSKKLMRVFARYEGKSLLHYDYDEGVNGKEQFIDKIVIRKMAEGEEAVQTRPTSCVMLLSIAEKIDGKDYAAEGGLPFHLIRKDNGKKNTVYSREGEVSLIGDADVPYILELGSNPIYDMKGKIEFTIKMDSEGKYQAVLAGYDAEDEEGRLPCRIIELTRKSGNPDINPNPEEPENQGNAVPYAPDEYRIVYEKEKVILKNMQIFEKTADGKSELLKKPIQFVFYNSTTQNLETTVTSKDGILPDVEMVKGQHYIVFAENKEYVMKNAYISLDKTGEAPIDVKKNSKVNGLYLSKRSEPITDAKKANRVSYKLPVFYLNASGDAEPVSRNVKFRFTSAYETLDRTSKRGVLEFDLNEDQNYMISVIDDKYAIRSFPMTVKDKSEFGAEKYPFDHFDCGSVNALFLIDKDKEHKYDDILNSVSGKTTVTGLRFGNGKYFINDRVIDEKIDELKGKDHEVLDIDAINMYRTELSKLAAGNFTITRKIPDGKEAVNVYYVDDNGKLQPVEFRQKGNVVTFKMNTLSMYNNVIEFGKNDYVVVSGQGNKWNSNSDKNLDFKIEVEHMENHEDTFENFIGVEVDGKPVAKENYTATKGSVKISLKKEFLETLPAGKHTLRALFRDRNKSAEAVFTITAAGTNSGSGSDVNISSNDAKTSNTAKTKVTKETASVIVKTGDTNELVIFSGILLAAFVLFGTAVLRIKKNR